MSRSRLESGLGEGGGVCSMATSSACDRFCRLLGCDSEPSVPDVGGDEAEEDDDGREALLEAAAAAARAACVMGTWMPRLGRESDLRRVL